MKATQLGLWQSRTTDCPFGEFIEDDDNHCTSFGESKQGYDVIDENHPEFAQWLADVRNVGFGDVSAQPIPKFELPSFVPGIRRGSQKLLDSVVPPFAAVSLGDIVSNELLSMPDEIRHRFGISEKTKIILLCYAKDSLIEKIWKERKVIFPKIAALGFDLVTAVNYSIWFNQPHAERLINLKRSLVTLEEFQELGIPTIPHIYWYGRKDLLRWCDWIHQNPNVTYVAINLQTERGRDRVWDQTIEDLKFFVSALNRPLHFLITGPSRPNRISQLQEILPNFSLTNGYCARMAASSFVISQDGEEKLQHEYSSLPKHEIMMKDMTFYQNIMANTLGAPQLVM